MIKIIGNQAEIFCLSNTMTSQELTSEQGMIYVDHKLGLVNKCSKTPADSYIKRYDPYKSALKEDHIASAFYVFDKTKGDNHKYDDDIRKEINKAYKAGLIPFSANVGKDQVSGLNSEALRNFKYDRDNGDLLKIIKQYFGITTYFDYREQLEYRFNQEKMSLDITKALNDNKLCLFYSYTGSGKTVTAIDAMVRKYPNGGFILTTTPIVDTMKSFERDINNIHFGTNRKLKVTYMNSKEFNKTTIAKIKKRVANGELIFLVLSVQDIRYNDTINDKENIRNKFKDLNNNVDTWIKDEVHYHYEGEITNKKFKNLNAGNELHLTATPYNIFQHYNENEIVSQTLLWALENQKHTGLPSISIESYNFSMSQLSENMKKMFTIEEGWNPSKFFQRDLITKEFIFLSEIVEFFNSCYGKSFSKNKNIFSINNDPKLSGFSKKYGMVVLPNGVGKDGASSYIPDLGDLLNDNIDSIYFIDSYKLEKDANSKGLTVGDYFNELSKIHNKIVILTCGKFLIGSDIPPLGHLVLMDKIQNIGTFEQVMGRIMRKYNKKDYVKIYSLSPSNELGLLLGCLSKINSNLLKSELTILDNVPVSEYINGKVVVLSPKDILSGTQDWFLAQAKSNSSYYKYEQILKNFDVDLLKKLSSLVKKDLPASVKISEDNGSKVKESKSSETKKSLTPDENSILKNAINTLRNIMFEAQWVAYTTKNYDYETLFKCETMLKMFKEDNIDVVFEMLENSKELRNAINNDFLNKKLSYNSLTPIEVSNNIFIDTFVKKTMGIVYMTSTIAQYLVDKFVVDDEYGSVVVVNALNGALPLKLREKYPNLKISCCEVHKQYEEYLGSLGFDIVNINIENYKGTYMKYDGVLLNSPYQKVVGKIESKGKTKSEVIWGKINANAFNLLKDSGYMATIHPGGWRFLAKRSKKELYEMSNIYKTNKILYMEFNDHNKGKETFNAGTDYDVVVLKKEKSNGDVIIKTKSDGLYKTNLNNFNMIPTDNIEWFESLKGNGDNYCDVLHSYSAYETRKDWMSKVETEEFKYPCVYTLYKNGLKLRYSNRNDRGHFGVPKLIIGRSAVKTLLDLKGEYGMCEFALAIVDTPKNLIEIQKVVETDKFIQLKNSLCGANNNVGLIDFNGHMSKFINEFKKDWWINFND